MFQRYCELDSLTCKSFYTREECEAEPDCDPANPVCGDDCA